MWRPPFTAQYLAVGCKDCCSSCSLEGPTPQRVQKHKEWEEGSTFVESALLTQVEVGPVIGKGSFGRVHKGECPSVVPRDITDSANTENCSRRSTPCAIVLGCTLQYVIAEQSFL